MLHAGRTNRDVVKRTVAALQQVQAHIVGVVLNRMPARGHGYYYYHYYSYYNYDSSRKYYRRDDQLVGGAIPVTPAPPPTNAKPPAPEGAPVLAAGDNPPPKSPHNTRRRHRPFRLPPLVIGLNQRDRWQGDVAATSARGQEYLALLDWLAPTPQTAVVSAVSGAGVDDLLALLRDRLPVGPRYFPEDQVTDANMRYLAAELIREKALRLLQDLSLIHISEPTRPY